MNNERVKKENNKKDEKYLIADVKALELTFKDGTKTRLKTNSEGKLVQLKVYPNSIIQNPFMFSVIQNYRIGINAADLADLCGYNCTKTFQRHFKENFKETVYKWMLNRKMEDIQALVINTDLSFSEISELFHFKNPAHLTNAYKKHYGISPTKDREHEIETKKKQ